MKKLLLFLLLALSLTAVISCDPPVEPEIPSEIKIDSKYLNLEFGAESVSPYRIPFTASHDWNCTIQYDGSNKDWLSLNQKGSAGSNSLELSVSQSDIPEVRTARIIINSGDASATINIKQLGRDILNTPNNSYNVPKEGGEISVPIERNLDYELTIEESAQSWISLVETKSIIKETLKFSIAPNDTPDVREGKIILTAGKEKIEITITQECADVITSPSDTYNISGEGGTLAIKVEKNVEYEYSISEDAQSWLIYSETKALTVDTLFFTVLPNESVENREGVITLIGGDQTLEITVVQDGSEILTITTDTYNVGYEGGEIILEVGHNLEYSCIVDEAAQSWITAVNTRSVSIDNLTFSIATNESADAREGKITLKGGDVTIVATVIQEGDPNWHIKVAQAREREVLIELYEKTGGDYWTNNTNWCSDAPVSEWDNITVNEDGLVTDIGLYNNNLTGELPGSLYEIENLRSLVLNYNKITGEIPKDFGKMKNLYLLYLDSNNLTGSIPAELGNLTELEYLTLGRNSFNSGIPSTFGNLKKLLRLSMMECNISGNIPAELGNMSSLEELYLYSNNLSGTIPAELANISTLEVLSLWGNTLSGKIPAAIMNHPCWDNNWHLIAHQSTNELSIEGVEIYAPSFSVNCIGGGTISNDIFAKNKLTVLYHFLDWCPHSEVFTPRMVAMYDMFKDLGLGVFSPTTQSDDLTAAYVEKYNIPWPCTVNQKESGTFVNYTDRTPTVAVIDSNGLVVFSSAFSNYNELFDFLTEELGSADGMDPNYVSTDFSKDGEVVTLQSATEGNGIDIIFIGDGYSDRLIENGKYAEDMELGMEKFFESEPVKSYRNLFNVYSVTAVSQNEVFSSSSSTALDGYFGGEMHVGGNNSKAMDYALKAIDRSKLNDAVIIVMMNSPAFAGTCYMYRPENNPSIDYFGNGVSVSYFPIGINEEALAQLIKHEAVGHGFAKLADEYGYRQNGNITENDKYLAELDVLYGWNKNIDFTDDPATIKWSKFLNDSRYANEDVGIYEGGLTYISGVYHSSKDGAMNSGVGQFNAPSREAIYYRIHKLAYGTDWEYDYEKFVEYDAINRKGSATTQSYSTQIELPGPPVLMNITLKEAIKK